MKPSQASDLKALKIILATVILLEGLFLEAQCLLSWGAKITQKICCEQSGSKEWLIYVIRVHICHKSTYVRGTYVTGAHICHRRTHMS